MDTIKVIGTVKDPMGMFELVGAMFKDARKLAMQGDTREMLWFVSAEAKFYYDTVGVDKNAIISQVIRDYQETKRKKKKGSKNANQS